jgi:tRNA threonylcarbamoyladenosine biosynthesis protein TsaE
MELALQTASADDTREVGNTLAPLLEHGDVVVLGGDLGAGKTTLVQGVAQGLDVAIPVTSPTFTLVKEYDGSIPLTHADVYRLGRVQDVVELGLEESDGVVFIEWGDVVANLFAPDQLRIELTTGPEESRRLFFTAIGGSWVRRWERLEHALEPWTGAR